MNRLVHYSTKLSLAGAAAVALLVLGGTSVFAPALAGHEDGHDGVARGRIAVLEERIRNCENNEAPCERTGPAGDDAVFADLMCGQGETIIFDETADDWVCS